MPPPPPPPPLPLPLRIQKVTNNNNKIFLKLFQPFMRLLFLRW
jgi:hypothetical protein